MKLQERQLNVTVEAEEEVVGFGIQDSAKMFRVLSDGLYNDKILAIIRELSSNAWDAHVEAGVPHKSFDVHLPTFRNPEFYIRDYGCSMSHEKVMETYRWYGGSDKTNSNSQVGCLGLGSKTPFCYNTRTFVVETWYEGMHRVYNCFFGEDGKPKIVPVSEEPSDEPTGTKITFPTKSSDEYEWSSKAEQVYTYYKVLPTFVGKSIRIEKPEYQLEGDGWALRNHDYEGARLIMGTNYYPISLKDPKLTTAQTKVLSNRASIDIFADIGDVNVDASREGLSYDNRTKRFIMSKVDDFLAHIAAHFQKELDQEESLWDARQRFIDMKANMGILAELVDTENLVYRGEKFNLTIDFQELMDEYVVKNSDNKIVEKLFQPLSWEYSYSRKPEKRRINSFRPRRGVNKFKFYENDLKVGAFVRCKHLAEKEAATVILFNFPNTEAKEKVAKLIGIDIKNIEKISTVPSPTVRQGGVRKGKTTNFLMLNYAGNMYNVSSGWKNIEVDLDCEEEHIYVEFNRFRAMRGRCPYDPRDLKRYLKSLAKIDVDIPAVYGVKSKNLNLIEKKSNWISLWDWIKDQVEKHEAQIDIPAIKYYQAELNNICKCRWRNGRYEKYLEIAHCKTLIDSMESEDTAIHRFYEAVEAAREHTSKVAILDVCSYLRTQLLDPLKTEKFSGVSLTDLEKEIYYKYPLLRFVDKNAGWEVPTAAYVDLMEGKQ